MLGRSSAAEPRGSSADNGADALEVDELVTQGIHEAELAMLAGTTAYAAAVESKSCEGGRGADSDNGANHLTAEEEDKAKILRERLWTTAVICAESCRGFVEIVSGRRTRIIERKKEEHTKKARELLSHALRRGDPHLKVLLFAEI